MKTRAEMKIINDVQGFALHVLQGTTALHADLAVSAFTETANALMQQELESIKKAAPPTRQEEAQLIAALGLERFTGLFPTKE